MIDSLIQLADNVKINSNELLVGSCNGAIDSSNLMADIANQLSKKGNLVHFFTYTPVERISTNDKLFYNITDFCDIVEKLVEIDTIFSDRIKLLKSLNKDSFSDVDSEIAPVIVLMFNQFDLYKQNLSYKDLDTFSSFVTKLLKLGSKVNIHIIIGIISRPSSNIITSEMKYHLVNVLCLGTEYDPGTLTLFFDSDDSRILYNLNSITGIENPAILKVIQHNGQFFYVIDADLISTY